MHKDSDIMELIEYPSSVSEAIEIQENWSEIFFQETRSESYQNKIKSMKSKDQMQYIAGLDISYAKSKVMNQDFGIACCVVWDLIENEEVETCFFEEIIPFEYKPGLLAFRECHLYFECIKNLKIKPEILLCDGHGYAHPKRFGLAVQIGMATHTPSIGIAKNMFWGDCEWKSIIRKKRNKEPIVDEDEVIGYALISNDNQRPVFVSNGYLMEIKYAIDITLKATTNSKQPTPLNLADKYSRERLANLNDEEMIN